MGKKLRKYIKKTTTKKRKRQQQKQQQQPSQTTNSMPPRKKQKTKKTQENTVSVILIEEETELTQAPKKDPRGRRWFFTWNNHTKESINTLLNIKGLKKYVIQEEISASDTPHLQGHMIFKDAKKFSTMKNHANIHWELTKNKYAATKYCTKLDTSTGKRWIKGFKILETVKDPMEGLTPYPYQKEILDMLEKVPDPRSIYWYWSREGNTGKSTLCKHICMTMDALLIGGATGHAQYAVAQRHAKGHNTKIILMDIPRIVDIDKISYKTLEEIKNGCFFSVKYESQMILMNPPHIIVFSNKEPIYGNMSEDRWNVKEITDIK
jgi:hypothetical protein